MRFILSTLFLFLIMGPCDAQVEPQVFSDTLTVDEVDRSFKYFLPSSLKGEPALLFCLHGSGGDADRIRMLTNYEFDKEAEERGNVIIVYPNGYDNHWNDCRANASYMANTNDIDELTFFSQMIAHFKKKFDIDEEAVFATGLSNGGHMCYKLAYELPNKFAGFAPITANVPHASTNDCTPLEVAVPMLIINGTKDPINPHEGGWVVVAQDSSRGIVLSTKETVDYWAGLLNCTPSIELISFEDVNQFDDCSAERVTFSCDNIDRQQVSLITVVNGGHTAPLVNAPPLPDNLKDILGNRNADFSSPNIILNFFENLR